MLVTAVACVPRGPAPPLLPLDLHATFAPESALRVVAAALRAERLPVDGDSVGAGQRTLTSTFVVRPGGLGESTIQLRVRCLPEGEGARVALDATAEEKRRLLEVGMEDPRDPRRLRGPHVVNPNDREVWQRIRTLLDRLAAMGIAPGAAGSPRSGASGFRVAHPSAFR